MRCALLVGGGVEMFTSFGKFARKLRMNNNELLKDMADRLKVTSSYLSAVEHGKKRIPDDWQEELSEIYHLSSEQIDELKLAIIQSANEIEINLRNTTDVQKQVAYSFARRLESLSEDELDKIQEILKK